MGIFAGVNEAKPNQSGQKLPLGNHEVKIEKCLTQRSGRSGGDLFIVEYSLEKTDNPNARIGAKYSWVQDMTNRNVALGNLKAFIFAVFKCDQAKDLALYNQVDAQTESILEAAVAQNYLAGHRLGVARADIKTQANRDFQKHTFYALAA